MHLADACIQSDLQCIQFIYFFCQYMCSLGIEPTTFALLMQCSTTEPQEQDFELFSSHFSYSTFQLVPKATFLIFKILIEYLFDFISALFQLTKQCLIIVFILNGNNPGLPMPVYFAIKGPCQYF